MMSELSWKGQRIYIAAEICDGAWRDVADFEWQLANAAEKAEPGDQDRQREWILSQLQSQEARHAR